MSCAGRETKGTRANGIGTVSLGGEGDTVGSAAGEVGRGEVGDATGAVTVDGRFYGAGESQRRRLAGLKVR